MPGVLATESWVKEEERAGHGWKGRRRKEQKMTNRGEEEEEMGKKKEKGDEMTKKEEEIPFGKIVT